MVQNARDSAVSDWFEGSPELVGEVKSASNTKAELYDEAMTTLAGEGAVEFWAVNPETATVTVHSKKRGIHIDSGDQAILLPFPRAGSLPVSDIVKTA